MRLSPASSFHLAAISLAATVFLARSAGLSAAVLEVAAQPVQVPLSSAPEARASRAYQAALHQGPLAVQAFLADFPKGADLHFHLGAGVYAETLIRVAAEDKVCIDPAKAGVCAQRTRQDCERALCASARSGE